MHAPRPLPPLCAALGLALAAAVGAAAAERPSLAALYEPSHAERARLELPRADGWTVDQVLDHAPSGPNPYLAWLPSGATPDYGYWRARAALEAQLRALRGDPVPVATVVFPEREPNDTPAGANPVPGFGTAPGEDRAANVTGALGDAQDLDVFALDLEVGDILGFSLTGAGRATLREPAGTTRLGTDQNVSFIYPEATGLPTVGPVLGAYVVETAGRWTIQVSGGAAPSYQLGLRLFRNGGCQKVFLDFDGPVVDPSVWNGPPIDVTVSPLASFLSAWGLQAGDENALIDGILAVVEENLDSDLAVGGANPLFDIQILNSRDHPGRFGDRDVSRVVVGGTINEVGIDTIGIAQTIDPGNFASEEDSIVLLDILSAPADDPDSLNQFAVGPGATKLDLVAVGLGNIAAHEAGHILGNFHTGLFSSFANIQDPGGAIGELLGVGADGVFGTADDIDVDFGPDVYEFLEGFEGIEDTLNTIALVMRADSSIFRDGFESGDLDGWSAAVP